MTMLLLICSILYVLSVIVMFFISRFYLIENINCGYDVSLDVLLWFIAGTLMPVVNSAVIIVLAFRLVKIRMNDWLSILSKKLSIVVFKGKENDHGR